MTTEHVARTAVEETLRASQDDLERSVALYRVFLYATSTLMNYLVVILAQPGSTVAAWYFTVLFLCSLAIWAIVRRHGARPVLVYGSLVFDLIAVSQVTTVSVFFEPHNAHLSELWAAWTTAVGLMIVMLVNVLRNNARAALVAVVASPVLYLISIGVTIGEVNAPMAVNAGLLPVAGLVGWLAALQSRKLLESYARHRLLKRFLPGAAFDRIVSDDRDTSEKALSLGGQRVTATLVATDLRGFTAMTERLTPEETIEQLNAYHGAMHEVLDAHGGVLDKFLGDGALVVFGSGAGEGGASAAAAAALACGRAMLARLVLLNAERAAAGQPALAMGIGIHTGEVIAGNIGSERRLEATVIGDAVNTASRLESLTKEAGVPLLVSAATVALLGRDAGLEDLGLMAIRGKVEPLHVYGLRVPRADVAPAASPVASPARKP